MAKRKKDADASGPPGAGCVEAGGHFADSRTEISSDGRFILLPRRSSVAILGSRSGRVEHLVKGIHQSTILEIVRVPIAVAGANTSKKITETYVSLDECNRVGVWTLTYNTVGEVVKFRSSSIASFSLDDLDFPDANVRVGSVDVSVERRSVVGLHVVVGAIPSADTASLVLVIESQLVAKSSLSREVRGAETENPRVYVAAEAVRLPLGDLLVRRKLSGSVWLFACGYEPQRQRRFEGKRCTIRSASTSNEGFVAVSVDRRITIWNKATNQLLELAHTNRIASMIFSPEGTSLVTGDDCGRVIWWKVLDPSYYLIGGEVSSGAQSLRPPCKKRGDGATGFIKTNVGLLRDASSSLVRVTRAHIENDPEGRHVQRRVSVALAVQHWHAHPVRALCYAPDHLYLMSGGEEGVVVFWHVNQSTRQFVARFGAPITRIAAACSEPLACVSLADNSLKVLDISTRNIQSAYKGVQVPLALLCAGSLQAGAIATQAKDALPITIQPSPNGRGDHVLLTGSGVSHKGVGSNSVLQAYNIAEDEATGHLQVNEANYVARVGTKPKRHQWTVQRVAMSADGKQLATVQFRASLLTNDLKARISRFARTEGVVATYRGGDSEELGKRKVIETEGAQPVVQPDVANCLPSSIIVDKHIDIDPPKRRKHSEEFLSDPRSVLSPYDERRHESGKIYVLKFWDVDPIEKNLLGNAVVKGTVEGAHVHDVTALVALPRKRSRYADFLSASLDSTWRVWRRQGSTTDKASDVTYNCLHIGTFRSFPVFDCVLSFDFSIAACAHQSSISLWGALPAHGAPAVPARQLLHAIPIPAIGKAPEPGTLRLCWANTVIRKAKDFQLGELLLVCCTGYFLWTWRVFGGAVSLVWFSKLPYSTPSILAPNSSGTPFLCLAHPAEGRISVHLLANTDAGCITCERIYCVETLQRRRLLGCSLQGDYLNAELVLLDSDFRFKVTPLSRMRTDADCGALAVEGGVPSDQTGLDTTDPEDDDNDPDDADSSPEVSSSPTSTFSPVLLSSFLSRTRPAKSRLATDSHLIRAVVGQPSNGPSQYARLPSTVFASLVEAYLPKAHDFGP